MKSEELKKQYLQLRVVQVMDDVANGVIEDFRVKTGMLSITDDVFPFVVELQDIYSKAEVLLERYVIPQMSKEDIRDVEKKVGDVVKKMSDKPMLGNYLDAVVSKISRKYEIKWVESGDVIKCEKCGKEHNVE